MRVHPRSTTTRLARGGLPYSGAGFVRGSDGPNQGLIGRDTLRVWKGPQRCGAEAYLQTWSARTASAGGCRPAHRRFTANGLSEIQMGILCAAPLPTTVIGA